MLDVFITIHVLGPSHYIRVIIKSTVIRYCGPGTNVFKAQGTVNQQHVNYFVNAQVCAVCNMAVKSVQHRFYETIER